MSRNTASVVGLSIHYNVFITRFEPLS